MNREREEEDGGRKERREGDRKREIEGGREGERDRELAVSQSM